MQAIKNVVILYGGEAHRMDVYADLLNIHGFSVVYSSSAETILERLRENSNDVCLMVLELVAFGDGNQFGGRRQELHANCALYILDEFDLLAEKDVISKIPKIILTDYEHVKGGRLLSLMGSDPRIKATLTKDDTSLVEFIGVVEELVK